MFRATASLMLFALAIAGLSGPAGADPFGFSFNVADPAAPSPVLQGAVNVAGGAYYGSVSARTDPAPDRLATARLRLGVRPRLGRNAFDINYNRADDTCCGTFDAGVVRPLGRGRFGANLSVDAGSGASKASTHADFAVTERVTLEGRLDGRYAPAGTTESLNVELGVVSALAPRSRLGVRLRDASDGPSRAEIVLRLTF